MDASHSVLMKRGTIIIPKENTNLEIDWDEAEDNKIRHALFMSEYAREHGLEIFVEGVNVYRWGQEYLKAGIMTLQIDEYSIFYVPDTIDNRQYYWFQNNRTRLKRYRRLAGVLAYLNKNNFYFEGVDDVDTYEVISILDMEIEERYMLFQEYEKRRIEECTKNPEYAKKL